MLNNKSHLNEPKVSKEHETLFQPYIFAYTQDKKYALHQTDIYANHRCITLVL